MSGLVSTVEYIVPWAQSTRMTVRYRLGGAWNEVCDLGTNAGLVRPRSGCCGAEDPTARRDGTAQE